MTEKDMDIAAQDTKAVVKKKVKKKPAAKKAVSVAPTVSKHNLVRVKLNFDTVNPDEPPEFDKATGSFNLSYSNILRRGDIVEVSPKIAAEWVASKVPMGFKGWGFTDGMEPASPQFVSRAEYV